MRLNYNYGVAALKWWGEGPEYLLAARKRPAPPIPAPLGPSRSKHDRSVTTEKFDNACMKVAGVEGSSGGSRKAEDTDERRQSEAERLVRTLWANTSGARNHCAKQQA
ncbi:hypothetical protein DFH09DRAFT_1079130 [Mycena vulgaris]|nr:hypothetical protein DFH09DRAFT_1079130 [Mycena vulgaris]